MGISTRKFSEFVPGSLNNSNQTVGLSAGANAIFPGTVEWTTATRPTMPSDGLLGYNTDLSLYEYYDGATVAWVQLATGASLTWNNITGLAATMSPSNGYVANNAGQVVLTLPAVCPFGLIIRVAGYGSGGWQIVFNASQNVVFGRRVATTSTGSLTSSNQFDQVELLCVVADSTFIVTNCMGNVTII